MVQYIYVWFLSTYSISGPETTYLKPSSHFLLHLNFVGGKNPFSLPFPFLTSAFFQEPN